MARSFWHLATAIASLPLETRDPLGPVDAIVVLGTPLLPDGSLSPFGRERIDLGCKLWHRNLGKLLLVTGGSPHSAPEAPAMGRYAVAQGVAPEALVVEARSHNTTESARLSAPLLRDRAVRRICVVTHPFHLRRARRSFRRRGFEAIACGPQNSILHAQPRRALPLIAREYAAWCKHWLVD